LTNRKSVLFQQDNVKPHTANRTAEKIVELEGIELLPHPAYSPDLAPSDYYLFRSAHFFVVETSAMLSMWKFLLGVFLFQIEGLVYEGNLTTL